MHSDYQVQSILVFRVGNNLDLDVVHSIFRCIKKGYIVYISVTDIIHFTSNRKSFCYCAAEKLASNNIPPTSFHRRIINFRSPSILKTLV